PAPDDHPAGPVPGAEHAAPEEDEDLHGGGDHAAQQQERIAVAEDIDAGPDAECGDEVEAADADEGRGQSGDALLPGLGRRRPDRALGDLAGRLELTEDR